MSKYALLLFILFYGCATTDPIVITKKFPPIPESLNSGCAPLRLVPDTEKLSVLLETVVDNYMLYHNCSQKVTLWLEWYETQKNIFKEVQ